MARSCRTGRSASTVATGVIGDHDRRTCCRQPSWRSPGLLTQWRAVSQPDLPAYLFVPYQFPDLVLCSHGRDFRRSSPKGTKQLSGFAKPTACGGDLRGISTMLVVAVLWSLRGTTAVRTTVHSTPPPPSDRRRLAWRAGPGLAHFPTRCHYSVFGGTTRNFFFASARSIARSASATASDLLAVQPPTETPVSSETDHFHTCRPTP